mgnify:CR=1 FL=1
MNVVGIVGAHGAGKTTLIEALVSPTEHLLAIYGDYAGHVSVPLIASGDIEGVVGLVFKKVFNKP